MPKKTKPLHKLSKADMYIGLISNRLRLRVVRKNLKDSNGMYVWATDTIYLNKYLRGHKDELYVFLHELVHWTGHPRRLRRFKKRTSIVRYWHEETVAEFGALALCKYFKVRKNKRDSLLYIQHYTVCNHKLTQARAEAKKAVSFILKRFKRGRARII